jgi:hypothetical protein
MMADHHKGYAVDINAARAGVHGRYQHQIRRLINPGRRESFHFVLRESCVAHVRSIVLLRAPDQGLRAAPRG